MSRALGALKALFEQRYRGLRLIELVGIILALILMFWLSLSKVREGEDIKRMNQLSEKITQEQAIIHDLKVTVTHLERPRRLEALAAQVLDMKTITAENEASLDQILEISGHAPRASQEVTHLSTGGAEPEIKSLVLSQPRQDLITNLSKSGGQR
jgi:hypothetical protein